jgi:hypothetical protein
MQPEREETTSQGFVDQPLPQMPVREGEAEQQRPEGETTAGTDERGAYEEAPAVDEPTS